MRVLCYFRSNQRDQLFSELARLKNDFGGLSLVQAAQISIEMRLGQGFSLELEKLQPNQSDPAFVSLAFAQACFSQKELECAEKFWSDALQKSPEQPQALWGLATLYRELGNQVKSRDFLRRASLAAPGYLRLLELRGASNW
jgi:Tfp pilus assembly protein PilF